MKRIIHTDKAPKAIGPYNQAVESNGTLYLSGQIPIDPSTGKISGTSIETQAKQVMQNLQNVIEAAGYKLTDVVKCTCYLTDLANFQVFNAIYATSYDEDAPARVTVEVSALPLGSLVEVDAIAVKH